MSTHTKVKKEILLKKITNNKDFLIDSIKILSDMTRRDTEKSYKVYSTYSTEPYYSNRLGKNF